MVFIILCEQEDKAELMGDEDQNNLDLNLSTRLAPL